MNKKLMITIGAILGVVLLGFGVFQTSASQAAPKLSSDDIGQMVKDQYPGEITEIELEKKFNNYVYEVEIKGDDKEYELKLDADTGEILKLEEKFIQKDRIALDDRNKDDDQEKDVIENEEDTNGENMQNVAENDQESEKNATNNKETEQTKKKNNNKKEQNKKANNNKKDQKNTIISAKEAINIALNSFPGTVKEFEFDKDDGRLIYEVEIVSGYEEAEVELDAYTGEIIKNKKKKGSKKYGQQTVISANEAIDIALSNFSGTVTDLELDEDDGRLMYEIEIKSGHEEAEIEIDAYTGEVLVIEIDTD